MDDWTTVSGHKPSKLCPKTVDIMFRNPVGQKGLQTHLEIQQAREESLKGQSYFRLKHHKTYLFK